MLTCKPATTYIMHVPFLFLSSLHTAASDRTLGVALAVEEEETVSLPVTCARGQVI